LKKLILFSSLIFFAACKEPVAPPPNTISLVIGNPVSYGLKEVLLFPVGGNYNPNITAASKTSESEDRLSSTTMKQSETNFFSRNEGSFKFDRNSSDEYINVRENDFDIRNLLFYNKLSGSTYPLTKDTLHILSFAIHYEFGKPLIFFRIVKKDINDDKKFNSKDAVMLYVSDHEGKTLTQITPENEQFVDYFYYPETKTILIKSSIDIDKNKIFTSGDETNFREMKIDSPAFGREIFTAGLKDSLKMMMR
jgi:hypothetical protein